MISNKILNDDRPKDKDDPLYNWYIDFAKYQNFYSNKLNIDPSIIKPSASLALLSMAFANIDGRTERTKRIKNQRMRILI